MLGEPKNVKKEQTCKTEYSVSCSVKNSRLHAIYDHIMRTNLQNKHKLYNSLRLLHRIKVDEFVLCCMPRIWYFNNDIFSVHIRLLLDTGLPDEFYLEWGSSSNLPLGVDGSEEGSIEKEEI